MTCKKNLDVKPDQEVATTVVWKSFGESEGRIPPIVEWKSGKELDCPGGESYWGVVSAGNGTVNRTCLLGSYVSAMHLAFVAIGPGQRYSDTAFAHELCHAFFKDQNHEHCASEGKVVTRANALLRSFGL